MRANTATVDLTLATDFRLSGAGNWTCGHTGDEYRLEGDVMTRVPGAARDILRYEPGKKLERIVGD